MSATIHPYLERPPLALAHRGGPEFAPHAGLENTLAAFVGAARLGYRYIETDVHLTADGVLVAFHDEVLDRVTDARGRIADLPWPRVEQARVGGREPIPTLLALLTALPSVRVNIDLKAPRTAPATLAVLRASGATKRACVGSFSQARLWHFRWLARRDGVATSAGRLGITALRLLPRAASRVVHTPGIAYQVPETHAVFGRRVRVVTPDFVAGAHAIDRQVHVWTVDDPAQMRRLLDLGVDGIITDRLDVLAEVLAERGHPLRLPPTP
ncbi:MAG: glycerophosphodiester phosphodiesterase family protein [Micrococcales bacterium]|nr:glycerophosphodiester phosphodiesterase family protein [Micrococcales bacterium]